MPLGYLLHGLKSANGVIWASLRRKIVAKLVTPVLYAPSIANVRTTRPSRSRPVFLVLRYKYSHGSSRFGISLEEQCISAPLRTADIAEVVEFYLDTDQRGGILGDKNLVDLIGRIRPDIVFLSSYDHTNGHHPNFAVLKLIRESCGIPLVVIWHDSASNRAYEAFKYMVGHVDLNLLLDSEHLAKSFPETGKFLRLWTPLDSTTYFPSTGPLDVPVSFLGSLGGYRKVREEYTDHLLDADIGFIHSGGRQEELIDLQSYADIMRRSKISLNFSHSVGGTHQLKFRVFEITHSGSMLLENENTETRQFFTPMVDYVPFSCKEDLLDKTRYYLDHEDERREIAYNGHMKATTTYSSAAFWGQVMEKLGELDLIKSPALESRK